MNQPDETKQTIVNYNPPLAISLLYSEMSWNLSGLKGDKRSTTAVQAHKVLSFAVQLQSFENLQFPNSPSTTRFSSKEFTPPSPPWQALQDSSKISTQPSPSSQRHKTAKGKHISSQVPTRASVMNAQNTWFDLKPRGSFSLCARPVKPRRRKPRSRRSRE